MPNQYDLERKDLRARLRAGKISKDRYALDMHLICLDEYADCRLCVERIRRTRHSKGTKGKKP